MTRTLPSSAASAPPVPKPRWDAVLGVAGGLVTLLLLLAGRHGYHLDELYFRAAGQHPDWGYVDQPPLVPLLARVQVELFGDTVSAIRAVPALLAGLVVVVAALIARELGGGGRAQVLAAVAAAVAPVTLNVGHLLVTNTPDVAAWTAVCWLVLRLARTGNTRLWLAVGAVVGVGVLAKYLVVLLVSALLVGLLVAGPRRLLWTWHLPAGAGIAAVIAAPTLIWQAAHGWPQFEMAAAVANALAGEARILFVPFQFLLVGVLLAPVWIAGLASLLRWRAYRSVAVAYLFMVALLLLLGAEGSYPAGLLIVLLAAGCVRADAWARSLTRRVVLWAAVAVNGVLAAVLMLPVLPLTTYAEDPVLGALRVVQLDQAGWPELADQVAGVYRSLPPADQTRAVLFAGHYGQAGALNRYGPERGLPREFSGHNSYAAFGRPTDDKTVVIAVGADRELLSGAFERCEPHGRLDFDLPVSDRGKEIVVCRGPLESWARLWPRLGWIGFQCPGTATAVTARSHGCE